MKYLRRISEEFDPMIGVTTFLQNPIMITLATAWLINGRFKKGNIKSNLNGMKNDFITYCNAMGYPVDKDLLDAHFNEMIRKIKKTLKLK